MREKKQAYLSKLVPMKATTHSPMKPPMNSEANKSLVSTARGRNPEWRCIPVLPTALESGGEPQAAASRRFSVFLSSCLSASPPRVLVNDRPPHSSLGYGSQTAVRRFCVPYSRSSPCCTLPHSPHVSRLPMCKAMLVEGSLMPVPTSH